MDMTRNIKISVAMCTYNGEKYIERQLKSIYNQTRRPDEVVICDDGSSDGTTDRISEFISFHHLENSWKLYLNANQKGYPANFYCSMSLCSGEYVFLSDQDDIWDRRKIEVLSRELDGTNRANIVACAFELIDESGHIIKTFMNPGKKLVREKNPRTISTEDIFGTYRWPGMVLAYRNEWFKNWASEEWTENNCGFKVPHDFLIALKAAEENSFFQVGEVLAYHRMHENNTGGEEHRVSKLVNKERKLAEIDKYIKMLESIEKENVLYEDSLIKVTQKKHAMIGRLEALKAGKVSYVLKNAVKNKRYTRKQAVISDLLICITGR